jgi:hypothetical protein
MAHISTHCPASCLSLYEMVGPLGDRLDSCSVSARNPAVAVSVEHALLRGEHGTGDEHIDTLTAQ